MTDQERLSSGEVLARALEETGNPAVADLIILARQGYYSDFSPAHICGPSALREELLRRGQHDLAERTVNGEFDAQPGEAEEWMATAAASDPELAAFAAMLTGPPTPPTGNREPRHPDLSAHTAASAESRRVGEGIEFSPAPAPATPPTGNRKSRRAADKRRRKR